MGGWPARYVTILFGNGDGTLGRRVLLPAGPSAHDTVAVDLNGDGHVDLASSGFGTSYVIPTNQGISTARERATDGSLASGGSATPGRAARGAGRPGSGRPT